VEAANNASFSGVLVPLLTLGLPTSATAAVMLAAFQIWVQVLKVPRHPADARAAQLRGGRLTDLRHSPNHADGPFGAWAEREPARFCVLGEWHRSGVGQ